MLQLTEHESVVVLLLQTDEQEVINFLLTTEIIPLCLRIMESGSELSKTVSQQKKFNSLTYVFICSQTYWHAQKVKMKIDISRKHVYP